MSTEELLSQDSNSNNNIRVIEQNNANKIQISKEFKNEFIPKFGTDRKELLNKAPIYTTVLFQIMADLKNYTHQITDDNIYIPTEKKQNQYKLQLWQEEFVKNSDVKIKLYYKASKFTSNRNKAIISDVLNFFYLYKNDLYTFKNSKGILIESRGGIIESYEYRKDTGEFEITLSQYWANKIVKLEPNKWSILNKLITIKFKSTKQRLFILWLIDIKMYSGTSIKFETIQEQYDLHYEDMTSLMKNFLKPIKTKLDNKQINNDWISFNYFRDPNHKNNIRIVPYKIKPDTEQYKSLSPEEKELIQNSIKQSLNASIYYRVKEIKRQHKLSNANAEYIKKEFIEKNRTQFEESYKNFKKIQRKEGKKIGETINQDFIDTILNQIEIDTKK